jgi:thiol:disulfide interchange protein DsbD
VIPQGWHTYWRNPGDNGLPIELDWTVPDGVEVGEIAWPAPEELPLSADIMDYGYKSEVTLPLPVTVSPDFAGDRIDFVVDATWLVCEDICIPEDRRLELSLPVGDATVRDEDGYWYIRAALDAVPQTDETLSAQMGLTGGRLVLSLEGGVFSDTAAQWRDLQFYPFKAGLMRHAAEPDVLREDTRVLFVSEPGFAAEE